MNVYTITAKQREAIDKAGSLATELALVLSEVTLDSTKQELDFEEAIVGLDSKGDN